MSLGDTMKSWRPLTSCGGAPAAELAAAMTAASRMACAVPRRFSRTARSFFASMPWLISSTMRKGSGVIAWGRAGAVVPGSRRGPPSPHPPTLAAAAPTHLQREHVQHGRDDTLAARLAECGELLHLLVLAVGDLDDQTLLLDVLRRWEGRRDRRLE